MFLKIEKQIPKKGYGCTQGRALWCPYARENLQRKYEKFNVP